MAQNEFCFSFIRKLHLGSRFTNKNRFEFDGESQIIMFISYPPDRACNEESQVFKALKRLSNEINISHKQDQSIGRKSFKKKFETLFGTLCKNV
jgi:hypothetical protein